MSDYLRERRLEKKREYYKKWRAEHPESVKAAQDRYWMRKLAELSKTSAIPDDAEIRSAEGGAEPNA